MEKDFKYTVKQPDVTVITPVYNSESFIHLTIDSVRNQSYTNWEMICVDDCSTDNSESIIREYIKQDSRIHYYKLDKNQGAAKARNKAIEMSKGRYIAFLDSDDLWKKNKLESQIEFMKSKGVVLTHTQYDSIDENGKLINKLIETKKDKVVYKDMLSKNHLGCLTVMYDSQKLGKVYMPDIRMRQDHALWIKIMKKGYASFKLNEVLATYRVHENSMSSSKFRLVGYHWKLLRDIENLNIFSSIYYTCKWMLNGFSKYYL